MAIRQIGADGGTESPKIDYPWRPIPMKNTHWLHANHRDGALHLLEGMVTGGGIIGGRSNISAINSIGRDWRQAEIWENQGLMINPASCLMGGLDVTSKIPICGLGVPFIVSEFDFVWLAVYFDANLRPIHAGIQKGSRFSRWYEYGGMSMGGFPRTVKTVRRDHIGVDVGTIDSDGFARPDVLGPEYDYVAHEALKEVEWLSPYGFLGGGCVENWCDQSAGVNGGAPPFGKPTPWHSERANDAAVAEAKENFIKGLRSELTNFILDPVSVKQWAAYCLLGYCTSTPPDSTYPYPNIPLKKRVDYDEVPGSEGHAAVSGSGDPKSDKTINFWYRQVATEHLMLQETNAGGVRACQIVPGFAPYIETLPHPRLHHPFANFSDIIVELGDGVKGTLPTKLVDHPDYVGSEIAYAEQRDSLVKTDTDWIGTAPNKKCRLPLPGENAVPTEHPQGVLGWRDANIWIRKSGKRYLGVDGNGVGLNSTGVNNSSCVGGPADPLGISGGQSGYKGIKGIWDSKWRLYMNQLLLNDQRDDGGGLLDGPALPVSMNCDTLEIFIQKERCQDSAIVTLRRVERDEGGVTKAYIAYAQTGGNDIVMDGALRPDGGVNPRMELPLDGHPDWCASDGV